MAIDIATNQKVGGSNPFRRTKNTEAVFYCFGVFLIIIGRDSNKAGECEAFGRKQPGGLFSLPWATSAARRQPRQRRKIPSGVPKKHMHRFGVCAFLMPKCRKGFEQGGQHARPLPAADEGSACWRSGRKNPFRHTK